MNKFPKCSGNGSGDVYSAGVIKRRVATRKGCAFIEIVRNESVGVMGLHPRHLILLLLLLLLFTSLVFTLRGAGADPRNRNKLRINPGESDYNRVILLGQFDYSSTKYI